MDSLGARLRAAREARGITVRQIADRTKISPSALEALERDDVSRLPGGIFVRAFVRAYATEVGLDPEDCVREFLRHHGDDVAAPAAASRQTDEESGFESQQLVARTLLWIVLVSAAVIVTVLYITLRKPAPPTLAETPPPIVSPVADSAPAPAQPAAVPASAGSSRLDAVKTGNGPMLLVIRATGPCWVDIVIDGERVLSRVLEEGERESLQVTESAVIRVGDAGAFAFSIDGREGRPLGAAGQVRTANITRESLASFLR